MRVHELASLVGKNSASIIAVLNQIQEDFVYSRATGSVTTDHEALVRLHYSKPAPDPVEEYKKAVQVIIDRITDEYGTDWCGNGVNDVSAMLQEVGLSLIPIHEELTLTVALKFSNAPWPDDDTDPINDYMTKEIAARLAAPFYWQDKEFSLNTGKDRYDQTGVYINDVDYF